MTEKTIKVEMTLEQLERVKFALFDRMLRWQEYMKRGMKKKDWKDADLCQKLAEEYSKDWWAIKQLLEKGEEDKKEESDARAEWCEKCNHPLWDGVCPDCGAGVKEEMDWEFFSDRDVQEQEVNNGN